MQVNGYFAIRAAYLANVSWDDARVYSQSGELSSLD